MVYRVPPRYKKALEPLIAAIILIAVTLIIAIAVVAWLLGVFGTAVGGREQLIIFPNATLKKTDNNNWQLIITIKNTWSASSQIIGINVGNVSCAASSIGTTTTFPVTINADSTVTITATCTGNFVAGVSYTIKVLTGAGNTFFGVVVAESG